MLSQMTRFYSFLWLNNIPLCVHVYVCVYTHIHTHTHIYTTSSLFTHPLIGPGKAGHMRIIVEDHGVCQLLGEARS